MDELKTTYGNSPGTDTKDNDTSDSGSDDQAGYRGTTNTASSSITGGSISRGIYGMGGVSASSIIGPTTSSSETVREFSERCRHIPMRLTEGG